MKLYSGFQCANILCTETEYTGLLATLEGDILETEFDTSHAFRFPVKDFTYYMHSEITKGTSCLFGICLGRETLHATSTQFNISTTTGTQAGSYGGMGIEYLRIVTGNPDACKSLEFDLLDCSINIINHLIFEPTITETTKNQFNDLKTKFPIGYITDFVTIMSTTTATDLPIIHAHIPDILGVGTGHSITLDINHSLDWVLNATTSKFYGYNPETDSTQTLYQITNTYWGYVLNILALIYIVSRLLSSDLVKSGLEGQYLQEKAEITYNNRTRDTERIRRALSKK